MSCLRSIIYPLSIWLVSITSGLWVENSSAEDLTREISCPIRVERDLEIRNVDGEAVRADLYRPDDNLVYPLVIMIHGGAWSAGDKWNLMDHAREMAQAGFVALSINYRLAPSHRIADQIDDCRAALMWAAQQAEGWRADRDRLCLWGYSAGAHLSAWMATQPNPMEPKIRCVVAGGAPCDFEFIPADSVALAHVFGGTRQDLPDVYTNASPLAHATSRTPPFFFFHGTNDLLVPPASSRKLCDRLSQLDVEVEYYAVGNKGHLLTFLDSTARRRAIDFLRKHTLEERY